MKFLISQILIGIGSVVLMLYLTGKEYFVPVDSSGSIAIYNVLIMGLLFFVLLQAIGSIISMLIKKKIAFGRKEFPPALPCLIDGIALALGLIVVLIMNYFHILSLAWGAILFAIIVVVIVLSR